MGLEDDLKEGFAAFDRGDFNVAADFARKALRASPKNAGALVLLGRLAIASVRLDVALSVFTALTKAPGCPADTWIDLANVLVQLRREEEAAEAARRATEIDPQSAYAFVSLGFVLLSLDSRDEAAKAFRAALRIDPAEVSAYRGLCRAVAIAPDSAEADAMRALLERDDIEGDDAAELHQALAHIHKRASDGAGFIAHFYAALKARRARPDLRAVFENTYDQYEAAAVTPRARAAAPSEPAPIFIVGMARSGTTLAEQIIGGAESVAMGGEIDYFSRVLGPAMERLTRKPFPQGLDLLSAEQLTALAQPYSAHLRLVAPHARLVTDKTPANFLFLGALTRLFPNSRIIWMRRDPMDTCFSILQQPFEAAQADSTDIGLVAHAYARQQRLGRIWERELGERMLAVRYEDLAARPEEQVRRIVAYCGLAWREDLLDFHARRSAVHTFSMTQVRKPISAESVGGWRAYAAELEPLRAALEAEGVAVD